MTKSEIFVLSLLLTSGLGCDKPGFQSKYGDQDDQVPQHVETEFMQHLSKYNLHYGTREEYEFRLKVFFEKHKQIAQINSENANFQVGHNQFSDWTTHEYKKLLGFRQNQPEQELNESQQGDQEQESGQNQEQIGGATILCTESLPSEVDWRKKGAVNHVKNQGRCGSCWAFSATCAIEGAHFIKTGKLLNLSEQQLVDCDTSSSGCNGGMQENAMIYAEKYEQELQLDYPYKGLDGQCQYHQSQGQVRVEKVHNVKEKSIEQLKAAIAKGPTSVTIEADTVAFQHYVGGILDTEACGTNLDHAVSAVGYGSQDGQDYYIVRNSWGADWGEEGYIRIASKPGPDGKGICGIQQISVWPSTD